MLCGYILQSQMTTCKLQLYGRSFTPYNDWRLSCQQIRLTSRDSQPGGRSTSNLLPPGLVHDIVASWDSCIGINYSTQTSISLSLALVLATPSTFARKNLGVAWERV